MNRRDVTFSFRFGLCFIFALTLIYTSSAENKDEKRKELNIAVTIDFDVVDFLGRHRSIKQDNYDEVIFEKALKATDSLSKKSNENKLDLFIKAFDKIAAPENKRVREYFGNYNNRDEDVIANLRKNINSSVEASLNVIRKRLEWYSRKEPKIVKINDNKYKIEISGKANENELLSLIRSTARLGFHFVENNAKLINSFRRIDSLLSYENNNDGKEHPFTSLFESYFAEDNMSPREPVDIWNEEKALPGKYTFYIEVNELEDFNAILERPGLRTLLPDGIEIMVESNPDNNHRTMNKMYEFYAVKKIPELTGDVIVNARADYDQNTNRPRVLMDMNEDGTEKWARITGENLNKRIAIVFDRLVYTAPTVMTKITGGKSSLTGLEDIHEAKMIEIILNSGSLKIPVNIIGIEEID